MPLLLKRNLHCYYLTDHLLFLPKLVVFWGLSACLSAYSFPLKYLSFHVWPVRILCMLFMSLFSCLPHCEIVPSFALGPLVSVTVFSDLKMSVCVFLWHTLFIGCLSSCFPPSPSDPFSAHSSHCVIFFPGAALLSFIFFPPFLTPEVSRLTSRSQWLSPVPAVPLSFTGVLISL